MTPLIAYYRVSTQRQEQSGLGLEAQERAVLGYAHLSEGRLLECFTEVESGRRNDRPELAKAIADAEALRATLVVAKLDRLTRNAAFLHRLLEAKVDFVACDNPHATKLTIQILAAIAEWEAEATLKRFRESLSAYMARGGLLGAKDPRCPGPPEWPDARGHSGHRPYSVIGSTSGQSGRSSPSNPATASITVHTT